MKKRTAAILAVAGSMAMLAVPTVAVADIPFDCYSTGANGACCYAGNTASGKPPTQTGACK